MPVDQDVGGSLPPGPQLPDDGALEIAAFVGLPDGSTWIRDSLTGDAGDPAGLGREVADRLLAAGAREVLDAAESI